MERYLVDVDATLNSIVGGLPQIVGFKSPLRPGDRLTISADATDLWSSAEGSRFTNADGVTLVNGQPDWTSYRPGIPAPNMVPHYQNAANYIFGIDCLVGSLDNGLSFFSIGSHYSERILVPSVPQLLLFYWGAGGEDTFGMIKFTIEIARRSLPLASPLCLEAGR